MIEGDERVGAFQRADGRKGIRNQILVIYLCNWLVFPDAIPITMLCT